MFNTQRSSNSVLTPIDNGYIEQRGIDRRKTLVIGVIHPDVCLIYIYRRGYLRSNNHRPKVTTSNIKVSLKQDRRNHYPKN